MNDRDEILVRIRDLSVTYHTRLGPVSAVDHVSFDIRRGEILGLVGESGCGKSTLGKALLRMIAPPAEITGGQILFEGEDILTFDERRLRDFRGRKASMIFQDPMTSLNPVQRVEDHLVEAVEVHEQKVDRANVLERVATLIERLGIQKRRIHDYPHQLSGGMRQRVMIGLGLVLNANLIIADEATTSLDVIVEAKLVDQLREIRDQYGVSILVITHNIALVAEIADRVAVMYAGHLVEMGSVYQIFDHPLHPYTRGLLRSVPSIKLDDQEELYKMAGEPPNLTHPPSGCRFHPRCPDRMGLCSQSQPQLREVAPGHWVQCWLYQDHPEKESPTLEVTE
ncbi:oligopeptide/dipeptide ABC transporter, ATP-binding protein, C-terminal domain [Anaerolinea thermolimosa]|uniref:ABC transporter ATP-binding protein n=1 Tax=Anaerolinea thermolimosa TaxID=229919 RepID=UPI00191C8669|nr:ABC transporter ATP-binding protein [Anaerolinea thermolimosa]GAP08166.1 oligopeptide/dipeptide ABC transporter, ATP-binding protein, C-terminal domain [Anaerolinea thermolimosa]